MGNQESRIKHERDQCRPGAAGGTNPRAIRLSQQSRTWKNLTSGSENNKEETAERMRWRGWKDTQADSMHVWRERLNSRQTQPACSNGILGSGIAFVYSADPDLTSRLIWWSRAASLLPLLSIMEKLLTSATKTSGEVMRALMAPCLVIYGEARHYFRIYDQQDIENASSGSFTSQLLI